MSHTPGPWYVRQATELTTFVTDRKNNQSVAEIAHRWNTTEELPNAHLIAAAPDLLEACRTALDILERAKTLSDARNAEPFLRDAVAAATGKLAQATAKRKE